MKRCTFIFMILYPSLLHTDAIDRFAARLNALAGQPQHFLKPHITKKAAVANADTGLLGPWLVEDRAKKLVAYDENYDKKGIRLYQLRVQQQEKEDCWIHALRNGLYMIAMASSPRSKFDELYVSMVRRQGYADFTSNTCPIDKDDAYALTQKQLACLPGCIPADSVAYLDKIVRFGYQKKFDEPKRAAMRARIKRATGQDPSEELLLDCLLLDENDMATTLKRLRGFIAAFHAQKEYLFCVALDVVGTDHSVVLVVHKNDRGVEYLFADSNNCSFKRNFTDYCKNDGPEFRRAISAMIRYIENPGAYDAAMRIVRGR